MLVRSINKVISVLKRYCVSFKGEKKNVRSFCQTNVMFEFLSERKEGKRKKGVTLDPFYSGL